MKTQFLPFVLVAALLAASGCNKKEIIRKQVVTKTTLTNVRLADGIPLDITLATRWVIKDKQKFYGQFGDAAAFDTLILQPKQLELANSVSIQYAHVDSVFTTQRKNYIDHLKTYLLENVKESDIEMVDVIISNIQFPEKYTAAKELLALQEQELMRIRKQSVINLENAQAAKEQAIAQGEVNVEQAKLNAELEKINAKTESSRRASMLARAETQKQVAQREAEAEKTRQILMAEADARRQGLYAQEEVDKRKKLNALEVKKQEELNALMLLKEENNNKVAYANNLKMAELCKSYPNYANFLVNQELAKKVQIAVLPNDMNSGIFSGLLNANLTAK